MHTNVIAVLLFIACGVAVGQWASEPSCRCRPGDRCVLAAGELLCLALPGNRHYAPLPALAAAAGLHGDVALGLHGNAALGLHGNAGLVSGKAAVLGLGVKAAGVVAPLSGLPGCCLARDYAQCMVQGYAGATPYTRTCLKFYFDGRRCVQAEFYSRCAENTHMRNLFTTRAACEAKCGGAVGY